MINKSADEKVDYFLACVSDSVTDLFYYGRKECDVIDREDICYLVCGGYLTKEDIIGKFKESLDKAVGEMI